MARDIMADRRYASTATTDMRLTIVRRMATTGLAGFRVACLSVRGRGFTDTMGAAFEAIMGAEASATLAATTDARALATVGTVAAPTDARLSQDAVLPAVQWVASAVAPGADFAVQPEVVVASTVEAAGTAADTAKGSRRLAQR